jgi:hypothetical protein
MVTTRTMPDVLRYFGVYARQLRAKVPEGDPNAKAMMSALERLEAAIEKHGQTSVVGRGAAVSALLWLILLLALLWIVVAFGAVAAPPSMAALQNNPTHQAVASAVAVTASAVLFARSA